MDLSEEIYKKEFEPFRFNITVNQYTISVKPKVERGCNSIQVTNLGTSIVTVNGITLFPSATPLTVAGDAIVIGGNRGEIYKGDLNISFSLPLGLTPLVEVLQKFYIGLE